MIPNTSGSLQLLRLFGIPIRVHFTFLFLVLIVAVFSSQIGQTAAVAVVSLALLFLCVVLHELGHALMARRFGIETREIVLYPIGGIARLGGIPSGGAELAIAAAGPAVNFLLAVLLALVVGVTGVPLELESNPGLGGLLVWLLFANVLLFLFNLLPAFPMDGGRILRALLTYVLPEDRATRFAAMVGQGLAMLMALFALFGPGRNLILLVIAIFVFFGAGQEASFSRTRSLVRGRRAAEAMMTRVETLAPNDTLEYAARLMLAGCQRDFPVIDAWGRVAGLLDRGTLLGALEAHGRDVVVLQVMRRDPVTVTPDAALEDVLRHLATQPGQPILVVENERFRGVVTWEKITTLLDTVQRL